MAYTNGRLSPLMTHASLADSPSQHSDSDVSDSDPPVADEPASDADAPEDEPVHDEDVAAASDSSEDVDAEGEPDGDYDSDSPPSEQAESDDAQSPKSQDSGRPLKRKASTEKEDYMTQNPELYGLRRSVRVIGSLGLHKLISIQGRARPSRRIVGRPRWTCQNTTDAFQVDSDDEDDDSGSGSDQPRKRQRTASRKGLAIYSVPVVSITDPCLQSPTSPHQYTARWALIPSRMATWVHADSFRPRSNANVSTS